MLFTPWFQLAFAMWNPSPDPWNDEAPLTRLGILLILFHCAMSAYMLIGLVKLLYKVFRFIYALCYGRRQPNRQPARQRVLPRPVQQTPRPRRHSQQPQRPTNPILLPSNSSDVELNPPVRRTSLPPNPAIRVYRDDTVILAGPRP